MPLLLQLKLATTSLANNRDSVRTDLLRCLLREIFGNKVAGTIPVELSTMTRLTSFRLSANSLTGTLPVELSTMTSLTHLQLYSNSLSGTIPVELSTMTSLKELRLYANSLNGTVPVELSTMTSLDALRLNSNSLPGTIPVELSQLTSLSRLDLYSNSLTGFVPSYLCNAAPSNCGLSGGSSQFSCMPWLCYPCDLTSSECSAIPTPTPVPTLTPTLVPTSTQEENRIAWILWVVWVGVPLGIAAAVVAWRRRRSKPTPPARPEPAVEMAESPHGPSCECPACIAAHQADGCSRAETPVFVPSPLVAASVISASANVCTGEPYGESGGMNVVSGRVVGVDQPGPIIQGIIVGSGGAPTQAPSSGSGNVADRLANLNEMRLKGMLTDDEFMQAKRALLFG